MDKTSKKILERMHQDGSPEQFAFWLFGDAVRLEAEACGLSVEDFANAVNHLIAEGWAEYVFTRDGYRSGVKLTHKGVHYKEFIRRETAKTALTSILIPILVSLITTLVASGLPALLQQISQWFSNTP